MKYKIFLLLIICSLQVSAQITTIFNFAGATNGSNPNNSLISDGTFLYGTTYQGGTNALGTVFKIMPDGTGYVKLMDLAGASNGSFPYGNLIYDGTFLYGMTSGGGTNDLGTIFKIMPDGTGYVKLLDFAGASNGSLPNGSLISSGAFLYGMTSAGGTNDLGTIFKIMPDGTGYVKLFDFAGPTNGSFPLGSLISDGTFLYGMTIQGGTSDLGTIFKIMPDGTGYLKLLDFTGSANGSYPYGSLIYDGTFLYGMAYQGGTNNLGTVFKIMPNGTGFTKLLNFSGAVNGQNPQGSLITDGTFLYGMTSIGGTDNLGNVFKIMPNGSGYVQLAFFNDTTNGRNPYGDLLSMGSLMYGMTYNGGTSNLGTVFQFCIPADTSVSQNGAILTSNAVGANYQWIYCDSAIVPGETNQSFTATQNGDYAVIVTLSCPDTSACYTVSNAGVSSYLENDGINIYPNPVTNNINISIGGTDIMFVNINDLSGRTVISKLLTDGNNCLSLAELRPGIYMVILLNKETGKQVTKKIIKL